MVKSAPKPEKKKRRRYNGLYNTPADKWFSLCVRERANWTCEYPGCGMHVEPPTKAIQCAHYNTRRDWSVRFDPLNAFAMCDRHHMMLDRKEGRLKFDAIYEEVFGDEKKEILREHWLDHAGRGSEYERSEGKGEIAEHYQSEYERLRKIRSTGVQDRLEFVGWI